MATAAIRMSLMTGRAVPRACFARTSTTTSTITPGSRRLLTTSSPAKNAQANSSKAAVEQQHETMDWNTYFALRKTRRNYERAFMVPSALVSLLGAGYFFAQRDFDPTPIFGMDQVVVYGIGTVAAGLIGLAMGPVIGNSIFRAANSRAKPLVDRMDTEFLKHIARNRADPAANSISNPIPDYYGEKIKSVSEYRSWLRKQREFRRKSTFYV
ncbi:TIM23 complex component [Mortierella sp. GBA39]|nr:TIM23 complex component [Mortierella sp. GBA39]